MRYVELFAGAGGLSMGLEAAGMHPVAHAEIEPHARAVLRHHWSGTPLHGDVTQVDWTQYAGQVDLVAGGSPCQDLSVAGKRAGLAGARSGLFFELIRAWEETGAPYCLWENVDGARSSNKGGDFAAVLSAFVGAPVAVPRDGWRGAGVAAGTTGVAAWRVLDLQHFGPPQRRRRVFVVAARTGGADPAEILALSESVCGHPSPRDQSRQGVARGAAGGAGDGSTINTITPRVGGSGSGWATWNETEHLLPREYGGGAGGSISWDNELNARIEAHGPLMARGKSGGDRNGVLAFTTTQTPKVGGDVALTLEAASRSGGGQTPAVLAFDTTQTPIHATISPALGTTSAGMGVLAFTPGFVARGEGPRPQQDLVQTLGANTQGDQAPHIVSFQQSSCTGRGTMGVDENTTVLRPVRTQHDHQMICLASGQANAEVMRDGVPTLNTIHEQPIVAGTLSAGRPRRLTPLECERLMGWPDRHAAQGVKEDGTVYALSDTARYRLCGNGVGTPVAAWIATRLVAAVEGACPP